MSIVRLSSIVSQQFALTTSPPKLLQGSHMLEKYLNIQDCLEKSLKFKFSLKNTWKHKMAEKSPWILQFTGGFNTVFGDLNQYKIVVPLFGATYAAPIF